MKQKIKIEILCNILEIPLSSWTLKADMNQNEAKVHLATFKLLAKNQRNILAKRYHPDMPRGDKVKMAKVNAVYDVVKELKITLIPTKPKPFTVHFDTHFKIFSGEFFNSSTSTMF